jgi:hypothetical protein
VTQYLTIDTAAPAAPTITSPANNSSDADGSIAFGGTYGALRHRRDLRGRYPQRYGEGLLGWSMEQDACRRR